MEALLQSATSSEVRPLVLSNQARPFQRPQSRRGLARAAPSPPGRGQGPQLWSHSSAAKNAAASSACRLGPVRAACSPLSAPARSWGSRRDLESQTGVGAGLCSLFQFDNELFFIFINPHPRKSSH